MGRGARGRPPHTLDWIAAPQAGATVVPAAGRYRVEIGSALADFPSADALADTARIMALIEAQVRRVPAQYLWIHKRFKTQPEGMASPYS